MRVLPVILLTSVNVPLNRLYGLTVHQTYRYFRLYPSDRHFLFWLVRVPSNLIYSALWMLTSILNTGVQVITIVYVHSTQVPLPRSHILRQYPRDGSYCRYNRCMVSYPVEYWGDQELKPGPPSYWHLITNFFNPLSLQEGYWYVLCYKCLR